MEKELLEKQITKIYKEGRLVSSTELSKCLNTTCSNVNYYISKYDLRQKDIFIQTPKKFIKLFNEINETSSYWLGYIQADGCLNSTKGRQRLILECKKEDEEILLNFCKDSGINTLRIKETTHINKKSKKITNAVRLELYRSSFDTFIEKYIQENKSKLNLPLPKDVVFYSYLCGLIDGDGTISNSLKSPQIILLVRNPMCNEIMARLRKDLPYPSSIWIQKHPTTEGLYRLTIGSGKNRENFKFLFEKLYHGHSSKLTRKYNILKNMF